MLAGQEMYRLRKVPILAKGRELQLAWFILAAHLQR